MKKVSALLIAGGLWFGAAYGVGVVATADFNGDRRADILWRNQDSGGTGENYLYPMNGKAILADEGFLRTVADLSWQIAGVGDFDGDGKADILWRNTTTGQNYIYFMDGTGIIGEGFIRTVADQNWQVAGVGDFDGDLKADIVWRNASTGDNYLYLMNGTAIAGEGFIRTVADLNWRIVAVGDYDGEGDRTADLFWRHAVTGQTYLYPMAGLVIKASEGFVRTVSDARWTVVPTALQPATQPEIETGLEWSGNENTTFERRIVFANPFPIYPATYVFRVFPRKKATGPNARYYTTFFWGNNGDFTWDGGSGNTYYGMHPYPVPPPEGPGQWEISIRSDDFPTGEEVQWDRWYTQVIRVWRENTSTTHHEFYWDWPDKTKLLEHTIEDPDWAARPPPKPAIVVGQAPNNGLGESWGGYPGFEEFKGIIRGMQFYNSLLTLPEVESELATPGSMVRPWYLNLNPTPADISDKSGSNHHPVWEGTARPLLWTGQ